MIETTKEQRHELYEAAMAVRKVSAALRRADAKVASNFPHWSRTFKKFRAAEARYIAAKKACGIVT